MISSSLSCDVFLVRLHDGELYHTSKEDQNEDGNNHVSKELIQTVPQTDAVGISDCINKANIIENHSDSRYIPDVWPLET